VRRCGRERTQQSRLPAPTQQNDRPSVILVEFLGFGGGDDGSPGKDQHENDQRGKDRDRQGYNPNSAVQFVEFGGTK